jgi:glutamate racemase
MDSSEPIGMFDSGVGGLTVASAIKQILPNEQVIYFGDTAHLPYGDKSRDSVIHYSKRISDFLLEQNSKVILIACNTASAAAYDHIKQYVGERAIVINVIDPVVDFISEKFPGSKTGVIGTKGTIHSGTYQLKLKEKDPTCQITSLATPMFVPMIEEGFIFDDISNAIIRSYLGKPELKNIENLILGCTHYPIIKNQIKKFFNFSVEVIDSASIVAGYVQKILSEKQLLNQGKKGENQFFVSDYTEYFEKIAKVFFEEKINLKLLDLWK